MFLKKGTPPEYVSIERMEFMKEATNLEKNDQQHLLVNMDKKKSWNRPD